MCHIFPVGITLHVPTEIFRVAASEQVKSIPLTVFIDVYKLTVGVKKRIERLSSNGNTQGIKQLAQRMSLSIPDLLLNAVTFNPVRKLPDNPFA